MLRNLPNNYSRDNLLHMLDRNGFKDLYDFVYLPFDFGRNANLGYAFVNLVSPVDVARFWRVFQGYSKWTLPTSKVCQVSWSGPHQGFEAHVARYRNSPVMHRSVPDEFKPVIFKDGVRQEFPPATRRLKPPGRFAGR
ncbi:ML4 [Symbiodinium pilosum]|uniref:ML4 protein n=1 Tax=Symbiodinium pilosum TaxID=2952 RepID=A0A812SRP0_SYMPI|nr:ML4 [Symbiodinium pilosum]